MNMGAKDEIANSVVDFSLPRYNEIPDVGLYLEQVVKYISEYLSPLGDFSLTSSMISNYVKKKLITNPVKKQYDREQIAHLIFIALAKNVLSMEDIRLLFDLKEMSYSSEVAYNYLCCELENVLCYVFGEKESLESVGSANSRTKNMLRNVIITIAHKIYLDKYLVKLHEEVASEAAANEE